MSVKRRCNGDVLAISGRSAAAWNMIGAFGHVEIGAVKGTLRRPLAALDRSCSAPGRSGTDSSPVPSKFTMTWRRWITCVVLVTVGTTASACGPGRTMPQQAGPCVPPEAATTPVSSRWVRVWTSKSVTARVGMFVGVEVIEPEVYTATRGFPWKKPQTTGSHVLVPARECETPPPTTLPLAVYYYLASGTGTETVTVPLSKTWLWNASCEDTASCAPLRPLVVRVSVRPGGR